MAFDEYGNIVPNPIPASVVLGEPVIPNTHPVLAKMYARISELEVENALLKEADRENSLRASNLKTDFDVYKALVRSNLIQIANENDGDKKTISMIADSLDIELSETRTYNVLVSFEIEIETPFDKEVDEDVFNIDLDFDVSSYCLDITDYRSDIVSASRED